MSDTAELQALVDASVSGATIELTPNRTYVVVPTSSAPCGILIPPGKSGVRMHGSGTTIMQVTGAPSSFSSFMIKGEACSLSNIRFSGGAQAAPLEADQHRHGVFVAAGGFRGIDLHLIDHTGDGIDLYNGADGALLDNCSSNGNHRDGFAFVGDSVGCMLVSCKAYGNGAQQVDVETKSNGQVADLVMRDCVLTSTGDYALTLGGDGFSIIGCEIDGGINISNGTNGTIERCSGYNPMTDKASITVWGRCANIHMRSNAFTNVTAKRGIWVASTGANSSPIGILIEQCELWMGADGASAISISGAIDSMVIGGVMRGNGVRMAGRAGIAVRSTEPTAPIERFEARDVRVEGFGQFGVGFSGLGSTPNNVAINHAYLSGMSFGGVQAGIAMDDTVKTLVTGPYNVADSGVQLMGSVPASVRQIQIP